MLVKGATGLRKSPTTRFVVQLFLLKQRYQTLILLVLCDGNQRWPVYEPQYGSVCPCHDAIMFYAKHSYKMWPTYPYFIFAIFVHSRLTRFITADKIPGTYFCWYSSGRSHFLIGCFRWLRQNRYNSYGGVMTDMMLYIINYNQDSCKDITIHSAARLWQFDKYMIYASYEILGDSGGQSYVS